MNSKTPPVTPQAALKPLYFPAQVTLDPAEHYDAGIPIRAVEGGLQGIIPAWLIMSIGDLAEVFWGNDTAAVWSKYLQDDAELDKDVAFTIGKGHVLEGDATPVFYRITRPGQIPEDSKPVQTLLVKLTRPGEYDDIPGDDGHSDLKFSLSHDEVDENLPPSGVTMHIVPYRNLTRYDRALARWGSQQVVHIVTPQQAQDPISNPIEVVFSRAVIEAAGDGDRVAVAFQVIDRCGNYPDERAPWSATRHLLVDLGGNRLDEPQVLVNGIPTNSIDLDQLGDDDVNARVYITKDDFAVGDKVLLTWIGTPAQGSQIIVGPLEKEVLYVPFQLDFPIPNAAVKAIAKGAASVGYVRRRSGESDRPSKNASVTVIGDINPLVAPTVNEAPGGILPPETPWATVNIPWYPGRNSSDLINLIWLARTPGNDTVYYEDPRPVGNVADHQPVLRSVGNAEIKRFNGLQVKVYYVVTDSETGLLSVRESVPFPMQVGVALPTFPRPEVEGADAYDVLDPDNVPPTGATLVMPYLETRDKDRVKYFWRGSASGGSTDDHIDLIPATAGKTVRITVEKKYVTTNLNGTVVAGYSIQRAGETLGHSRELTLRIGAELDLPRPFLVAPAEDPIDVLAYPEGITVRIEFPEALSGDRARLVEVNPPAGSPQFPLVEFNSNKRVNTVLSPAFLAARHGKGIELRWNLNRNNAQIGKSPILPLNVLKIGDGDVRLPEPEIQESNNTGELDVNSFEGDATFKVLPWDFSEAGQLISATLSSDFDTLIIANNIAITSEEAMTGVKKSISRDWLNSISNGASALLETKVIPGRSDNLTPITFLNKRYTITNDPLLISENWENSSSQTFTLNYPVKFSSGLTFTLLSGSAYLEPPNSPYYPAHLGRMTLLLSKGLSLFELPREARNVSFTINSNYKPGIVTFRTKNNEFIDNVAIPITDKYTSTTISFTSPTRKISSFEINLSDSVYADNFLIT